MFQNPHTYFMLMFKWIVQPKMTILSFTHPQVVPNLNLFILMILNVGNQTVGSHLEQGKILWKSIGTRICLVTHILQFILFCVQENSYRFGKTWGWVNDRIVLFGWTIPLSESSMYYLSVGPHSTAFEVVFIKKIDNKSLEFSLTLSHLEWTEWLLRIQTLMKTGRLKIERVNQ